MEPVDTHLVGSTLVATLFRQDLPSSTGFHIVRCVEHYRGLEERGDATFRGHVHLMTIP